MSASEGYLRERGISLRNGLAKPVKCFFEIFWLRLVTELRDDDGASEINQECSSLPRAFRTWTPISVARDDTVSLLFQVRTSAEASRTKELGSANRNE